MGILTQQPQDIFTRNYLDVQKDYKESFVAPKDPSLSLRDGDLFWTIWMLMGRINDSYKISGKANRHYMESGFQFVKESAGSMKNSQLWKAWGTVGAGVIGLGYAAFSLYKLKGYANSLKEKQPIIDQKNQEIRDLNNRNELRAENLGNAGARPGAMKVSARNSDNPRDAGPAQLTEGQKSRETQVLQNEIDDLRSGLNKKLGEATQMVMLVSTIAQGIQGLLQFPASRSEEAANIEKGVSDLIHSEQNVTQNFHSGLDKTFGEFAASIREIIETAKASAQMR
ncbi:MAG: hypothetical protein PVI40_08205 [Chlamydiota bacterium]|jgi:hypothetical protein